MALEVDLMLPVDPMTRVAAALEDRKRQGSSRDGSSSPTKSAIALSAALGDEVKITSYMSLRDRRRAIYRLGNEAFRDRVMLAWAEGRRRESAAMRALVAHAQMWKPPSCRLPATK